MNKCLSLSVALILCGFTLACSKVPGRAEAPAAGIAVGNGLQKSDLLVFASKYHFFVRYAADLDLQPTSDEQFTITNQKLAQREVARASTIKFEITPFGKMFAGFASSRKLANHVKGLERHLSKTQKAAFLPVELPGASGFYYERREAESLTAEYYLLTGNLDLITVKLNCFRDANGLALVAPIVHSFTYDITPPELTEFKLVPESLAPGGQGELRFRATDGLSGVSDFKGGCSSLGLEGHKKHDPGQPRITICGTIKKYADDWYGIALTVNPGRPSGRYTLLDFTLQDRAGNTLELEPFEEGPRLLVQRISYHETKPTTITVPILTVEGSQAGDTTGPTVEKLEIHPSRVRAGENAEFRFRARDEMSGIEDFMGGCQMFIPTTSRYTDRNRPKITLCGSIRKLGGDWFAMKVPVGKYLPRGEYFLASFVIGDQAGNRTYLKIDSNADQPWPANPTYLREFAAGGKPEPTSVAVVRVQIDNPGPVDITPPTVLELALAENEVRAGAKTRLRIRAVDDVSGITDFVGGCWSFIPIDRVIHGIPQISVCGKLRKDGGDWYSLEVEVGEFLPGGEYYLTGGNLADQAENYAQFTAALTPDGKKTAGTYLGLKTPNEYTPTVPMPFPLLRLRVVR